MVFLPSSSFFLLQVLSSSLVLAEITCAGGVQPICPPLTPGPSQQGPWTVTDNTTATSCPRSCDPHANTCDPTTAPTCIYPDPRVSRPRAACACRPGYKASGYANNDARRHWRLPVRDQDHRVWVAEGVKCDTLCNVPHGVGSCREVTLLSEQCIGKSSMSPSPLEAVLTNDGYKAIPQIMEVETAPDRTTYIIQDKEILGDMPLFLPSTRQGNMTSSKNASSGHLVDELADSIGHALPAYLTQHGMAEEEIQAFVNELVPALTYITLLMFNSGDNATVDEHNDPAASQDQEEEQSPDLLARRFISGKFKVPSFKVPPIKIPPIKVPPIKVPPIKVPLIKVPPIEIPPVRIPPVNEIGTNIARHAGEHVTKVYNEVKKKISEIGRTNELCSFFASNSLEAYMRYSNDVAARDSGPGEPITRDQMFFLYPIFGSYPEAEKLRGHYGWMPKAGFETFSAITFNRDMYFVDSASIYGKRWAEALAFRSVTGTLVHEVRHTEQYRDLGFSKIAFGLQYLFQYCKSGWSYNQIDFERDARSYEGLANELLNNELGYSFFEYWTMRQLFDTMGYPLYRAVVLTEDPYSNAELYELQFQNGGVLQGKKEGYRRCFRVLNSTIRGYLTLSNACTKYGIPSPLCPLFHKLWQDSQPEFECVEELTRTPVDGKCG